MNKKFWIIATLLHCGLYAVAETETTDSLRHVNLEEAQVFSTRATARTPIAFVNISKEAIQKQNVGLDIPFFIVDDAFRIDHDGCRCRNRLLDDTCTGYRCDSY